MTKVKVETDVFVGLYSNDCKLLSCTDAWYNSPWCTVWYRWRICGIIIIVHTMSSISYCTSRWIISCICMYMHLYMRPKLGWQYCMHDRRKKRAVYNHCIISLTLVSLLWIRKECNTSIMNITQQNCSKCNACDLVQSFACWQQSMAMRDLEQSSKPIISLSNAQSA